MAAEEAGGFMPSMAPVVAEEEAIEVMGREAKANSDLMSEEEKMMMMQEEEKMMMMTEEEKMIGDMMNGMMSDMMVKS